MEDYATATRNVPEKRSYVNTDGQSTISSHMLEEMERRAKDPISKMDVRQKVLIIFKKSRKIDLVEIEKMNGN